MHYCVLGDSINLDTVSESKKFERALNLKIGSGQNLNELKELRF